MLLIPATGQGLLDLTDRSAHTQGHRRPRNCLENILLIQKYAMSSKLGGKTQLMHFSCIYDDVRTVKGYQETTLVANSERTQTETAFPWQVKVAREFASKVTCRDGTKTSTSVVPVFIYNGVRTTFVLEETVLRSKVALRRNIC